jgi:hypothetical protein
MSRDGGHAGGEIGQRRRRVPVRARAGQRVLEGGLGHADAAGSDVDAPASSPLIT